MNIFLYFTIFSFVISNILSKRCEECHSIKGKISLPTHYNHYNMRHQQDWKSLQIVLNSGKYVTYPNEDGYFEFNNIPSGTYLLEVTSILFHYDRILIELPFYDSFIWNPYSSKKIKTNYPLVIKSEHPYQYFEKVEEMTLGSLIKNQYVLMIGVTVFMLFFAKKMPNMEELQQQMQEENQKPVQQAQNK